MTDSWEGLGQPTSDDLAAVSQFFEGSEDSDDHSIDDVLDEAAYEAARRMGGVAERSSLWLVRVQGERIVDGWLDNLAQVKLGKPLSAQVEAASGKASEHAKIGLVGVSVGSVVLHYRPKSPVLPASPDHLDADVPTADQAIRRVLDVHRKLEEGAPYADIIAASGNNSALLKAARGMTEVLDEFDLNLSSRWWTPNGQRLGARLGERGREHARDIFQATEKIDYEILHGRVTAMDLDGEITLRATQSAPRVKIRIAVDDLTNAGPLIGETVTMRVKVTEPTDQVGLKGRTDREFVEFVEDDQPSLGDTTEI